MSAVLVIAKLFDWSMQCNQALKNRGNKWAISGLVRKMAHRKALGSAKQMARHRFNFTSFAFQFSLCIRHVVVETHSRLTQVK